MDKLLQQQRDRDEISVKPIQDVSTSWWSTYSMISRLPRLKPYINSTAPFETALINLMTSTMVETKAASFPILSRLARETLCVPETASASSDRLFNAAGLTVAKDRGGLIPDNAADIVFLNTSWGFVKDTTCKHVNTS